MTTTRESACRDLQALILKEIVLAPHIGVRVTACDERGLVLAAPLAANSNLHGTAFAGSLYSLAALAGWGLVTLELQSRAIDAEVVIQGSRVEFLLPVDGDFTARAVAPETQVLDRCMRTLARHGRARVAVSVVIECRATEAVRLSGTYAIRQASREGT